MSTEIALSDSHTLAVDTVAVPQQISLVTDDETPTDDREHLWDLLDSLPDRHPARREVRNDIVAAHLPLVVYLARRYHNRGETLDDLIQVGSVGLIKSVDRFDRSHGVAFSTFATPTILGEIKRHFRDKVWMVRVPRTLQELRGHLTSAREELTHQLSRSPTVPELAAFMDLSEEEVLEALDAANAYSAASLDASAEDGSSARGSLEDQLGTADDALDLVERRQCVAPLLDALSERERRIIFLRFFREKSQVQIAEELGISQMHVSRLITQILGRLHEQLAEGLTERSL
jgi:RNA polymerase sigma-B factor